MGDTKHTTHQLKNNYPNWPAETGDRVVEEVANLIKNFNLDSIRRAARSYNDAADALDTAKESLKEEAVKLAKVWEGKASVEAQTALGLLWVSMDELAKKLRAMHKPVDELGKVVEGHQGFVNDEFKGILPTWVNQGLGDIGSFTDDWYDWNSTYTGYYNGNAATSEWSTPNKMAAQHLKIFTEDLQQVHELVPGSVEKVLRDIKPPAGPPQTPPPVTYPTNYPQGPSPYTPTNDGPAFNGDPNNPGYNPGGPDLGTDDPGSGYDTPQVPGYDPDGTNPDGTNPDGTNPGDPNNPGGTQYPDGTTYPPGGTTTTDPSVNPAGLDPSANPNDPRNTSLADYTPNPYSTVNTANPTTGYLPTTGYTPGTTGGGGTAVGGNAMGPGPATSIGTRAGTGMGMPFLPMGGAGGAGGGGERSDRESTTWLTEDDDVWNDDTTSVNSTIA